MGTGNWAQVFCFVLLPLWYCAGFTVSCSFSLTLFLLPLQVFHCHFNNNFFPLFLEHLLSDSISASTGSILLGKITLRGEASKIKCEGNFIYWLGFHSFRCADIARQACMIIIFYTRYSCCAVEYKRVISLTLNGVIPLLLTCKLCEYKIFFDMINAFQQLTVTISVIPAQF